MVWAVFPSYAKIQLQAKSSWLYTCYQAFHSIIDNSFDYYFDETVLTRNDDKKIQNLKHFIANKFKIKGFGSLKYFISIEVGRSKHGIFIYQQKYTLDLLKEMWLLGCKAIYNIVEVNGKLGETSESPLVDEGRYQRLVSWLINLSHTCAYIFICCECDESIYALSTRASCEISLLNS